MKTNYKYLLPALMLLLPACQREMAELKELVSGETVEITVSMDPETKATLSEEDGAMCFSSGDAIKVFDGTAVYSGVTSSTSSDGLFAMASGFNRAGTGYAGFPAGLVSTITSEGVTFALPGTYEYAQVGGVTADEARVLCPMVGTYAGGQIILKQAGAVIRFYVTDIVAGSLTFTFPTDVTGTTAAIPTPTGDSDGILASGLTESGKSITVTGVPAVPNSTSICITLPVPTGTAPQNIMLENIPADGSMPRFASAAGSSESLPRAAGYRMMFDSLNELEAIDLGLSVKWANMNVGATSETGYGDYFAWGETETKEYDYFCEWSLYKWGGNEGGNQTKYNESDGKTVLDLSDDAAHVNWGGNWRMPTSAEYEELATLPNEWVDNYNNTGIAGRKFTASNGRSVFFPAAGRNGGDHAGESGSYWSSTLGTQSGYAGGAARRLGINESNNGYCGSSFRYYGMPVRPVYQEDAPTIELASVEISPESVSLWAGETQQLTATAKDANGNDLPGATIFWSNVEGSSAFVNYTGLVTASTSIAGTTSIRATAVYNGVTKAANCTVTVHGVAPSEAEAVDLGLSVKWANINVGSASETDFGDYFAWGETEPKEDYSWSTYKWGIEDNQTKYNSSDGKTTLDFSDDAAHFNWGGNWRMPTDEEIQALIATKDNTTDYEWVWYDGFDNKYQGSSHRGYLITSKKPGTYGNHIFLPDARFRDGLALDTSVGRGYYWSSSIRTNYPYMAKCLFFSSSLTACVGSSRYFGYSVRPVLQGEAPAITLTSVEISPESATIWTGETQQLTATAKDASGNTISDAAITWSVVSGTSATVNASTGLVTASATEAGETVIRATATYGGVTQTADCTVTVKALPSFSIGSNKKVQFSPGNLQYRASTNTLRFAEHQYDYVGNSTNGNVYVGSVKSSNNNISSTYSGWIDLFGWATSGYNGKNPYLASSDNYEYGPSITSGEWTSDSNEWDWGYRNAIVNGSSTDPAGTWRTLTFDEWTYIVNNRSNTTVNGTPDARFTPAIVNTDGASVNGLILFPDNYSGGTPSGVTWGTINGGSSWGTQCTSSGWSALEAAGCVFLPAAGYRFGAGVYQASEQGFYWASTAKYAWNGHELAFVPNVYHNANSSANGNDRARGHSVRLVRDL